jgi:hypothetical protein
MEETADYKYTAKRLCRKASSLLSFMNLNMGASSSFHLTALNLCECTELLCF